MTLSSLRVNYSFYSILSNSIKINLSKGGPLGGRGWNMIFSEILESLKSY